MEYEEEIRIHLAEKQKQMIDNLEEPFVNGCL